MRGVDKEIGRIVDALDIMGLGKNTWVVIAGDHGEELGEHGDLGHNFVFYEHSIRTPMMFRRLDGGTSSVSVYCVHRRRNCGLGHRARRVLRHDRRRLQPRYFFQVP